MGSSLPEAGLMIKCICLNFTRAVLIATPIKRISLAAMELQGMMMII